MYTRERVGSVITTENKNNSATEISLALAIDDGIVALPCCCHSHHHHHQGQVPPGPRRQVDENFSRRVDWHASTQLTFPLRPVAVWLPGRVDGTVATSTATGTTDRTAAAFGNYKWGG